MGRKFLLLVAVITLAHNPITAEPWSDPNCADVVWDFLPCLNFLHEINSSPSYGCCSQINDLNKIAKNKTSRQRICQCIEDTVFEVRMHLFPSRVKELAGKCGVKPHFAISNHMDCKATKESEASSEKDAHV